MRVLFRNRTKDRRVDQSVWYSRAIVWFTVLASLLVPTQPAAAAWGPFASPACQEVASSQSVPQWTGDASQWRGYKRVDFQIGKRAAYVVVPNEPAPGNPWVWRARFPDFHAEADGILLERGFHVFRLNTDGMLGSPAAMEAWDQAYQYVVEKGLAKKCALEGVSRGGLFIYGFASRWPERVACIYADTPVCDIRSWPGGKGKGLGSESEWQSCLNQYGLTGEQWKTFGGSPVDRMKPVVDAGIPILHIVSLNDEVVPPEENTFLLQRKVKQLGGRLDIIRVAEGTDASHGHHFDHPASVQVADFMERHATVSGAVDSWMKVTTNLEHCFRKFQENGKGRVAFVGGSITKMDGWRQMVMDYLKGRFPKTEFEFIDAGIPSTGSVPGAFRLDNDVLNLGKIDLLLEEASVNDLTNGRSDQQQIRGMEGILRKALRSNPEMSIVVMHFACPDHIRDYRAGQVPATILRHQQVADHYGVSTIDLAKEVTQRMDRGQFSWRDDFQDLHPSRYGHRIYAAAIRRCLGTAFDNAYFKDAKTGTPLPPPDVSPLPPPLDRYSFDAGQFVDLKVGQCEEGFQWMDNVDPRQNQVGGSVRPGFHDVPMLVATRPGAKLQWKFEGRAVGLLVAAGPDAGVIRYRIDQGPWQQQDLFTKWSQGLHLPWVYLLAEELDADAPHTVELQLTADQNSNSRGTACRIVRLLVNGR